jgi:hypothetical protein
VEGSAPNLIEQFRVGEVKAVLLPADEDVAMSIDASEPGTFTLDVFTPGRPAALHFGPIGIRPEDRVRMTVKNGAVTLHRSAPACHNIEIR